MEDEHRAVLAERGRLARELHDDTIQSLIAFKQRVQLVEMDWEGHPVVEALAELENVAEQTIENLRRMVGALRPIYLEDLGLVAAINMLAADTGKKLGAPVEFTRQGKERRLEAPVELALYRIVQEALSNITRHSGATHALIQMAFLADGVRINIEDDGKGFSVPRSPAEFAPSGHFGLLGMFERADLIGGEMKVDAKPGKGTRLTVIAAYALPEVHERDETRGLFARSTG
jgi:signal transduction histidine kinase